MCDLDARSEKAVWHFSCFLLDYTLWGKLYFNPPYEGSQWWETKASSQPSLELGSRSSSLQITSDDCSSSQNFGCSLMKDPGPDLPSLVVHRFKSLETVWDHNCCFKLLTFGVVYFFSSMRYVFFWSIIDLQCCVSFKYTAKWISFTYTYIHSFLWILSPYRLLKSNE